MKLIIIFLISSIILFNSCTKYDELKPLTNQPGATVTNTTPESLRGREFVYDSLEWIDNDFGNPIFYLVDVNLFMPGRHITVAIKHDTSGVWEQASYYSGGPGSWGYLYGMAIGVLTVLPNPAQPAMLGKRFSLKVKFL